MSYDIRLEKDGETVCFDHPHFEMGGTFAVGGTSEAWLNVTYNYAPYFYRVMGEKGIRTIYGMTAEDSLPVLADAISKLDNDFNPDYWKPTEGNAKKALQSLWELAKKAPRDAVWSGD